MNLFLDKIFDRIYKNQGFKRTIILFFAVFVLAALGNSVLTSPLLLIGLSSAKYLSSSIGGGLGCALGVSAMDYFNRKN